jgi:hypothetical protein
MTTKRALDLVWVPLEDIEASLGAFASCPGEIRSLTHPEIVALMHIAEKLGGLSRRLKDALSRAEGEPYEGENEILFGIKSADCHILVEIRRMEVERRDRAARILRRAFGRVGKFEFIECRQVTKETEA